MVEETDRLRDAAFIIPPADRAAVERIAGAGAATYGEVLPAGATLLFRALGAGRGDVFYDLGSGGGALVLQCARETAVDRAIGIELSHARTQVAAARLSAAPQLAARVAFIEGDLAKTPIPDATIVFAGSLCFPDALLRATCERVLEAAGLRRFATIRSLPRTEATRFVEIGSVAVAATWSNRVVVRIYAPR